MFLRLRCQSWPLMYPVMSQLFHLEEAFTWIFPVRNYFFRLFWHHLNALLSSALLVLNSFWMYHEHQRRGRNFDSIWLFFTFCCLYLGHMNLKHQYTNNVAKFMSRMCFSEKETKDLITILTEPHKVAVEDLDGFYHKADFPPRHTRSSSPLNPLWCGDTYCPSLPEPLVTHH